MFEIPVLLFVVSCSADLLSCEEVSRTGDAYPDMPACRAARREMLRTAKSDRVIMARCRYDPHVAAGGLAHPLPLATLN